jgi:hypothetical protein
MNERRDPPDSVIEVGYLLTTARNRWPDGYYLSEAISKVEAAHDELIEDLADFCDVTVYRMDSHDGLADLCAAAHAQVQLKAGASSDEYRVMQGKFMIGRGHKKLADMLIGYGYRLPTAKEFAKVHRDRGGDGDGGSR